MMTHRLTITGMTCDHCTRAVRSTLEALPEVRPSEVQLGSALIVSDGSDATLVKVRQAIADAGYSLTTVVPVDQ
jgi:copper chaperone